MGVFNGTKLFKFWNSLKLVQTAQPRCSWLIWTYKTVTNTEITNIATHFQWHVLDSSNSGNTSNKNLKQLPGHKEHETVFHRIHTLIRYMIAGQCHCIQHGSNKSHLMKDKSLTLLTVICEMAGDWRKPTNKPHRLNQIRRHQSWKVEIVVH